MAKMRLQLRRLDSCMDGTRFWYAKGGWLCSPCTLVTSRKDGMCIVHGGHEFSFTARRWKSQGWRSVWVEKGAAR